MDEYAHRPVLLHESVALLITEDSGTYVDGTLGGGGHTQEILNRLSIAGNVIGFDADAHAIEECSR
ncbi:MAG TPA: 16S rRNA (cytosine(1402)-N(4))-methyltransferase, partial [Candidatus Kapabacteria bacterium]|nr:16S rRNA (cytosine(1402)-N(4))-methyltransferase [Candidatus Kapabacteria bacterium]